jgi:hypothetical protein
MPTEFEQFLEITLDRELHNYVMRADFPYEVFQLIKRSSKSGWYPEFIMALMHEKPREKAFTRLAFELKIGSTTYEDAPENLVDYNGLQALVNRAPFFDPEPLISNIIRIKRCLCRIHIAGPEWESFGTGFLVGADLLLTNYHVMEPVFKDNALAQKVSLTFDYENPDNGNGDGINPVTVIKLAREFRIADSAYAQADATGIPEIDSIEWPADRFDYALIRLEREIAAEPVKSTALRQDTPPPDRGYIRPSAAPPRESKDVIIFQHPKGGPVKIAIGLEKILGMDRNKRRVRYAVNTLAGSSGSPCFDQDFNWTALHNSGDPLWNPQYNQGIPVTRILQDLAQKQITLR